MGKRLKSITRERVCTFVSLMKNSMVLFSLMIVCLGIIFLIPYKVEVATTTAQLLDGEYARHISGGHGLGGEIVILKPSPEG